MRKLHLKIVITFYVIFVVILTFSCTKEKENLVSYYTITDSIKLDDNHSLWQLKKIQNGFVGIERYDKRLELISDSGELISFFGRMGKGPCEFTTPQFIDFYDNYVCVVDKDNTRITIINLGENSDTLKYINEFAVSSSIINAAILNEETIIYTCFGEEYNVKLCTYNGTIIGEYSTTDLKNFTNMEDIFKSIYYVDNIDNYLMFANPVTMELKFYFLDGKNMIKCNEIKTNFEKTAIISPEDDNGIDITGIRGIYTTENDFFVFISPKLTNKFSLEQYSKKGKYLGDCIVSDLDSVVAASVDFSNQGNKLWIMDFCENDTMIYIAEKKLK